MASYAQRNRHTQQPVPPPRPQDNERKVLRLQEELEILQPQIEATRAQLARLEKKADHNREWLSGNASNKIDIFATGYAASTPTPHRLNDPVPDRSGSQDQSIAYASPTAGNSRQQQSPHSRRSSTTRAQTSYRTPQTKLAHQPPSNYPQLSHRVQDSELNRKQYIRPDVPRSVVDEGMPHLLDIQCR